MKAQTLICWVVFVAQVTANHLCRLKKAHNLSKNNAVPIRVFAFDFDGTATTLESKSLLDFAYEATLQYQQSDQATKDNIARLWHKLMDALINRIYNFVEDQLNIIKRLSYRIKPERILLLRKTLATIDNMVNRFLNSKKVQNNFLKGMTMNGIKDIAKSRIQLCSGVVETLEHPNFQDNPPNVISAGQSKMFEEFVFAEYNAPRYIIIHAGELVFKNNVSTGKVEGQLETFDKEK